jgi:hypothetical protein
VWWNDAGVHQNLTFAVQPDPISGMQCWHQRVHVTPAEAGDEYGDVVVDTAKSREAYLDWLAKTRPAPGPDGLRRPLWYARPLKPAAAAGRPWRCAPEASRQEVAVSEHLDGAAQSWRVGQAAVGGQQRAIGRLGERCVAAVVGGDVCS